MKTKKDFQNDRNILGCFQVKVDEVFWDSNVKRLGLQLKILKRNPSGDTCMAGKSLFKNYYLVNEKSRKLMIKDFRNFFGLEIEHLNVKRNTRLDPEKIKILKSKSLNIKTYFKNGYRQIDFYNLNMQFDEFLSDYL